MSRQLTKYRIIINVINCIIYDINDVNHVYHLSEVHPYRGALRHSRVKSLMITTPLVCLSTTNQNTTSMTPEAEQWAYATRNNIDPKIVSRLPRIPKAVKFSNAKLIGSGVHSEVYSVSATYKKRTVTAALKIFSERWTEKFEKEVGSYEFLEHFSVWGVVPVAYGCDKDW